MSWTGRWSASAALALVVLSAAALVACRSRTDFTWPDEIWAGYRPGADRLAVRVRLVPQGDDLTALDVIGSATTHPIGAPKPDADDSIEIEIVDSDRVAGSEQLADLLDVGTETRDYVRADAEPVARDHLEWWLYRLRE